MKTHANRDDVPTPVVIDDSWIALQLQGAIRAVDAAFGPGTARERPGLVATLLLHELADVVANAIREARTGD